MSDIDAFFMTIKTMFFLLVFYQFVRLSSIFPQLVIVLAHVEYEVELKLFDHIFLPWFLLQNPDILKNAMDAFNNNESVAEQIFEIIDDDEDDGEAAIYEADLKKLNPV
jgi:hypothetical protein